MDQITTWLLEGDPAIRWQTLRDLVDAPPSDWQAERARTLESGWGARLLAQQAADGRWGGGIYSPKWISTTYTLLALRSVGIPATCAAAQRGAHLMLAELLGEEVDARFHQKLADCDRCIVGMILQIAVYFGIEDERIELIVANLLDETMSDGAWNCRRHSRPKPHHSSFHTTFNVLEGLREYLEWGQGGRHNDVLAAEQNALEFMLQHRLFKSDKTGEIINPKFTQFALPQHRWQYDVLRALTYFARANAPRDPRLQDAIDLLHTRRLAHGQWAVGQQYTGKLFFDMEKRNTPSRWNTLAALRVLRWWERT